MLLHLNIFIYLFNYAHSTLTFDDLVSDSSWVPTVANASNDVDEFEDAVGIGTRAGLDSEEDVSVDCFGLSSMLQRVFRWMFQPQDVETVNVRFFLTTRNHRERIELPKSPEDGLRSAPILPNAELALIIHGFMSNSDMFWVKDMANALLDKSDMNVVAVDWGGGSLSWKYWRAVGNTRVVSKEVAKFLRKMFLLGLSRTQVHCIGHSLGAHICSFAARRVGAFGRITGLDPAQPCFSEHGLNASDALHVDVVHTNTGMFGRVEPMGNQDFYPNGGRMQPGCALRDSNFLSKFPITRKKLEGAICSHGRSYEFFIDSLRSKGCTFWGHLWDFSAVGALDMVKRSCSPRACVPLGLESSQYPGKGPYYVPTKEKTPFCIADPKATTTMKVWGNVKKTLKKKFLKG